MKRFYLIPAALLAVSCAQGPSDELPSGDTADMGDAAGTRPAGQPQLVTLEGRIGVGTECPVLTTPDGERWSLSLGEADFGPGDYVEFTGEVADASFCMEGEGTLIAQSIREIPPPARDRDPARAGGVALDTAYVTGSWVAKGLAADCDDPDFIIAESPGAIVLEASVNGAPESARIVLGDYPRIDFDEPMPDLPLESRGPDGIAIMRPATDAAYDPMTIGSATIAGDGVVFVKCA